MTVENERRGVHVSAGDGIVAHVENLTAFAHGDEERLNELLVRLNALAGAPWQEIVRTITAGITEADYDDHPVIACVRVEEDRVAALVFGDTSLSITIDGSETTLDGRDSSTWIDVALHGPVDLIHAGTQSDSVVVGVLRDGVIPAGGFLLDTTGPMPASGRWYEMTAAAAMDAELDEASADEDISASDAPLADQESVQAELIGSDSSEADSDDAASSVAASSVAASNDAASNNAAEATAVEPQEDDAAHTTSEAVATAAPAHDAHPVFPQAEAPNTSVAQNMFARIEELGRPDHDDLTSADAADVPSAPPRLFGSSSVFSAPDRTDALAESVAPTSGATPTTDAVEAEASESVQTLASTRPQLRGVRCSGGHLTAPREASCRTCGEHVEDDAELVIGDRPVLGTISFDDGAVLPIDRPAVVGSDVPSGYIVDNEPATIVRLDDGRGGISAVQVEVRLSGWDVDIVDMQSKNGTYTMVRGERQTRTRLRAGQSVTLQPGMTVETGGRSFTYTVGPTPLPE